MKGRCVLFAVEPTTVRGRSALVVRGDLDLGTAPEFSAAVLVQLATGPGALVIDLTETTFVDSSGVRELARAAKLAAQEGVVLHLLCPPQNRAARLPIDLLDLATMVPVIGSAAELPAHLTEGRSAP